MSDDQLRVQTLLSSLCEGKLSEEQRKQLNQRLRSDPAARSDYLDYLALHAALCQGAADETPPVMKPALESLQSLRDRLDGQTEGAAAEASAEQAPLRRLVSIAPRAIDPRLHPVRFWSTAVGVTAVVWLLFAVFILPSGDEPSPPRPFGAGSGHVVGRLVRGVNASWEDETAARYPGAALHAGEMLGLRQGLAQIELESGTRLVVQSPCRLTLVDEQNILVAVGKITAFAGQGVAKFQVETPLAKIVDLGTEFGVFVDDSQETEVHVFEGVVEVRCEGPGTVDGSQVRRLQAGESTRVGVQSLAPVATQLNANQFVRQLPPPTESEIPEQLVPVTRDLALWLAADARVQRDAAGNVMAWGDIPLGPNQLRQNASQSVAGNRPLWIPHAMGGKPALRFNGTTTQLVTARLARQASRTVFSVVQPSATGTPLAGQVYNGNGPPHIVLAFDARSAPLAWMFAGTDPGNRGRTESARSLSRPGIISYVYDFDARRAQLFMNGNTLDEAEADVPATSVSNACIGRHPGGSSAFRGDLAELIVYNGALRSEELKLVHNYLFEKYSIRP